MSPCSAYEMELINGCQRKSKKYQELLYKHFYGYVLAIGLSYVRQRETAQEIANDSFEKVFKAIDSYDKVQPFKAWLRKITVHTAIDHYRKHQKHKGDLLIEGTVPCLVHKSPDMWTVKDIYTMIGLLPEILRMVFNLYEIEGYKHHEIADKLGISESTSRTYLMRAKQRLRTLMQLELDKNYGSSIR